MCKPEVYREQTPIEDYQKYASQQKSRLIPILVKEDRVAGVATYGAMGKITRKISGGIFAAGAAGGRKLLCSVFAGFSAKTFPGFDYLTEFKSNQVRFID